MNRTIISEFDVALGDCDPAGIVFFPNYARWMDEASRNYLVKMGAPSWQTMAPTRGALGMQVLEAHTRFRLPATYGTHLHVHTRVTEWRENAFVQEHVVKRGDEILCESTEVRAFVVQSDEGSGHMEIVSIPCDIRDLGSPTQH